MKTLMKELIKALIRIAKELKLITKTQKGIHMEIMENACTTMIMMKKVI